MAKTLVMLPPRGQEGPIVRLVVGLVGQVGEDVLLFFACGEEVLLFFASGEELPTASNQCDAGR